MSPQSTKVFVKLQTDRFGLNLQDGAELALALCEEATPAAAIARADAAMFARAEPAAAEGASNLELFISPNGGEQVAALFRSFAMAGS